MKFFVKKLIIYLALCIFWSFSAGFASASTNVYYSVGQSNSTELMTGSPNITVSSGVANFSVPQTGNIGVGDRVIIGGTTLYISGKISTSQWNVVTNLGVTPSDISFPTAVTHIYRTFASLSSAIANASGATYLNNTDLIIADVVLNIPCYYDTGADITAVMVNGYTTDVTRYINIYTPSDTSIEVNNSQRHDGKWNSSKYNLSANYNGHLLYIQDDHVRVDGLQIYNSFAVSGNVGGCLRSLNTGLIVSNNIIRRSFLADTHYDSRGISASMSAKIYNNIVYNCYTNIAVTPSTSGQTFIVFNNTTYNAAYYNISRSDSYKTSTYYYFYNNIAQIAILSDYDTFTGYSYFYHSNNVSLDTTSPDSGYQSKNIYFVNEADPFDFHLASTDISAKNLGTDLSSDPNLPFSTDIDGQGRTVDAWDIGADEYSPSGNFTLSVWVKPSTSIASKAIVGKSEELRMVTNGSGQPLCQIKSDGVWQTAATSSEALTVGEWSQVVCAYDRTTMRVFVDGLVKGEQALTVAPDDTSSVFEIGHDASSGSGYGYYSGLVDNYRFFTYAMGTDDVKREFNNGKSMRLGSSGSTSGTGAPTNAASGEYCVPGDTTSCAPPVLEMKMDEKVAGDAKTLNDTSGNGNNGTSNDGANNTGMDCSKPGKLGSGCEFDGVDDYVAKTSFSGTISTGGTISLWAKINSYANDYATLVTQSDSSALIYLRNNPGMQAAIYDSTGALVGSIYLSGLDTPPTNRWIFITLTWNSTDARLYIDGVQKGIDTSVASSYRNMDGSIMYLGTDRLSAGRYFNGSLDQVRIYNYSRTPAQIAWEYNKGKPIAQWKMDEDVSGNAQTLHDESGNANNGTTDDGANNTGMDCTVDGKFGKGCEFDGTDDYVRVADHSYLDGFSTAATWSFWVNMDTVPTVDTEHDTFLMKYNTTGDQRAWMIDAQQSGGVDYISFLFSNNGVCNTAHSVAVGNLSGVVGQWHHVVVEWISNSTSRIWLDGDEQTVMITSAGCGNTTSTIFNSTSPVDIGASTYSSGRVLDGKIDDIRIYNYPLTQEQINQTYNDGSSIKF